MCFRIVVLVWVAFQTILSMVFGHFSKQYRILTGKKFPFLLVYVRIFELSRFIHFYTDLFQILQKLTKSFWICLNLSFSSWTSSQVSSILYQRSNSSSIKDVWKWFKTKSLLISCIRQFQEVNRQPQRKDQMSPRFYLSTFWKVGDEMPSDQ